MKSYLLETPTLHWLIEPYRGNRSILKRKRLERASGPLVASQAGGAWIPVDSFAFPEDAATAVAEMKTGVMEWDRHPVTASFPKVPLSEWQTRDTPTPDAPNPPLSAHFQAAWRRLHRRMA